MNAVPTLAAASLCLAALLASHSSSAQAGDEWKFQAVVYLYLPSFDGPGVAVAFRW